MQKHCDWLEEHQQTLVDLKSPTMVSGELFATMLSLKLMLTLLAVNSDSQELNHSSLKDTELDKSGLTKLTVLEVRPQLVHAQPTLGEFMIAHMVKILESLALLQHQQDLLEEHQQTLDELRSTATMFGELFAMMASPRLMLTLFADHLDSQELNHSSLKDTEVDKSGLMMSTVLELKAQLETVHHLVGEFTTVFMVKMLELLAQCQQIFDLLEVLHQTLDGLKSTTTMFGELFAMMASHKLMLTLFAEHSDTQELNHSSLKDVEVDKSGLMMSTVLELKLQLPLAHHLVGEFTTVFMVKMLELLALHEQSHRPQITLRH
jgi:hypothetical protein